MRESCPFSAPLLSLFSLIFSLSLSPLLSTLSSFFHTPLLDSIRPISIPGSLSKVPDCFQLPPWFLFPFYHYVLLSIVVSLLFSSFSVAAAPPSRRDPIQIPVFRRSHVLRGGRVDLNGYARVAAGLRRKYKYGSSVSRRAQNDGHRLN
jgi:hypothetical protein